MQNGKEQRMLRNGCLGIVGLLVGLSVIGAFAGDPVDEPEDASLSVEDQLMMEPSAEQLAEGSEIEAEASDQTEPEQAGLTGPQMNARRSAADYLAMSGFSRAGLIDQLSSEYGDGYARADAEAAVASLNVDWNEQAARSANDYLQMSGFSCSGLIEQLSSSYGEQYTQSQAEHGAVQAGAC